MRPVHLIAVLFALVSTLVLQEWVGEATLYADGLAGKRLDLHRAILENEPPGGGAWSDTGAKGTQLRVATVYLAEGISRLGPSVLDAYRVIDTVSLFAALLLLMLFLRGFTDRRGTALATLYVVAVLPLTYLLHYFHPWDRPSLVLWLGFLILLRRCRIGWAVLLLVISVPVKFDTLFLPLLVGWVLLERTSRARALLVTAVLLALMWGEFAVLRAWLGDGWESRAIADYLAMNLKALARWHVAHPVVLAFALPLGLAARGWRGADRFARGCALLAVLYLGIYFVRATFAEVRALVPMLVLLLPAALTGLRELLGEDGIRDAGDTPQVVLRRGRPADIPALFEFQRDPQASRMAAFTTPDPDDREAFTARWHRLEKDENVRTFAVLCDGEVAGSAASFADGERREVTYWIGRPFWGRGVATAALRELLRRDSTRPLFARVAAENTGSVRVLEKTGFRRVPGETTISPAAARQEPVEEWVLVLEGPGSTG